MNSKELLVVEFINQNMSLSINIIALAIILFVIFLSLLIFKNKKSGAIFQKTIPIRMQYSIGGQTIEYEILRSYKNIETAHRVYIEIMTRKAGQPFDHENDVIVEIYNSWYEMFSLIRKEIKDIPGNLIKGNETTRNLVSLLMDVLNIGLRPHLTNYQAKYRKWWLSHENEDCTPQELQKQYPDYQEQVKSIREVNMMLVQYCDQLKKIVYDH